MPGCIREIMDQRPRFRVHPAPEGDHLTGRIPGNAIDPDGVVVLIEQRRDRRQLLYDTKDVVEIIAIAIDGVLLEIQDLPVSGLTPPLTRTGEQRLFHQAIVLHKTHEDTT